MPTKSVAILSLLVEEAVAAVVVTEVGTKVKAVEVVTIVVVAQARSVAMEKTDLLAMVRTDLEDSVAEALVEARVVVAEVKVPDSKTPTLP
jgi:hypothetical protein